MDRNTEFKENMVNLYPINKKNKTKTTETINQYTKSYFHVLTNVRNK